MMDSESAAYQVVFSDTAIRSLRKMPRDVQKRILAHIERLAENPMEMPGVKRLVEFDVSYRLRVGDYRILFDRDDTIRVVDIVDVLPRGHAYRRK